jgi:LPXTG-motif cell wall-anchored protein
MPSDQTLYTIEYPSGGSFARLGSIGADGVVTPIGDADYDVNEVRDADYDWDHNVAYVLDVQEGQCDIWTVDLDTGVFTHAWEVLDAAGESMAWCDAMMVAGPNSSQIWVSGSDSNGDDTNTVYARETGLFIETTEETVEWQSMDYFEDDDVYTFFLSNEDVAGNYFYNAVNDNAVSTGIYDNIHSISYDRNGVLWFTDWNDVVSVGTISATTGNANVLTSNLRYANGDQWGTDAIFWAHGDSQLAETGVNATGIAFAGFALAAAGFVAIRRRTVR